MRKHTTLFLSGSAVVIIAAVMVAGAYWATRDPRAHLPVIDLYGLVVDETGKPVNGAEVTVRITTSDPPPPRRGQDKVLKLYTGNGGKFSITGERGLHLAVADVRQGGLICLIDYAEHPWLQIKREMIGNQFFNYSSAVGPVYLPDPARPAVFALHPKDSAVAGKIIRGGADRYPNGTVVINEPRTPIIPSVGAGAPKTVPETDERHRALNNLLTGRSSTRASGFD